MKTSKDYLAEANAVVPRMTAEEAITAHAGGGYVVVDVRDSAGINKT